MSVHLFPQKYGISSTIVYWKNMPSCIMRSMLWPDQCSTTIITAATTPQTRYWSKLELMHKLYFSIFIFFILLASFKKNVHLDKKVGINWTENFHS